MTDSSTSAPQGEASAKDTAKPPATATGAAAATAKSKSKTKTKSPQAKAQDDQVMATNNSSIVSKRSVEKLYYPDEPPFFRHFVRRFQRRAPLINRGYWLRLRAIDVLVRDFLKGGRGHGGETGERAGDEGEKGGRRRKRGVVVNLGCGSDVLPWQCLTRYPEDCEDVKFVDVDFPDLIERKRQTVLSTPELIGAFTGVKEAGSLAKPVVFESDQYVQIGCDLRDLKTLEQGLASVVGDFAECEFIFVAEVSITYMETEGADEVIRWTSTLGDAEFVLLEQILPDGEDHPFASTMLDHFQKLNTPPKSVRVYPTVPAQHARFASRGWDAVNVWTLWQAWADETFLSASERRRLDEIEQFDEWEEFALFGSHYCVVHARAGSQVTAIPAPSLPTTAEIPVQQASLRFDGCPGQKGQRRFAAAVRSSQDGTQPLVLNALGLGTSSRLHSYDVFSLGPLEGEVSLVFEQSGPASRMCHSLTDLGGGRVLLAGGRGSPSAPLQDCWLLDKNLKAWRRTHELPVPLYRHSVTALGELGFALLVGGRGETDSFDGCLLYHPDAGWINCETVGDKPATVYGAAFTTAFSEGNTTFSGFYAGGLEDGLISDQILLWEADVSDTKKPNVKFTKLAVLGEEHNDSSRRLLTRFGATCLRLGDEFLMLGGVARDHLLSREDEVLLFSLSIDGLRITRRLLGSSSLETGVIPRPLFVGHSAVSMPDGGVVVVGGGATCFSMGTFWNKGIYTLHGPGFRDAEGTIPSSASKWVHAKTIVAPPKPPNPPKRTKQQHGNAVASITPIVRLRLETADDFIKVVREGRPVVLEGLDLGSCVTDWTLSYLVDKVGADRKVVIHEAATQAMDFTAKNFRYVTTDFDNFAKRVQQGDKLYLRALSHEKPSEAPAVLADDFPALTPDFVLPSQLSLVTENLFSSVLRVSGPVNMWLHYDVMANVYCQIGGSKRLLLFPPSDVDQLSFAPGASSSNIDVFSCLDSPELAQTRPHEAVLSPGDVLFLPPLWLHTATPTSETSIAVNVFFRDLESRQYAPGRDVYGNRDLAAYEKGRQDVARIANSFRNLPSETRQFYLLRLADELGQRARG